MYIYTLVYVDTYIYIYIYLFIFLNAPPPPHTMEVLYNGKTKYHVTSSHSTCDVMIYKWRPTN